MNAAKTKKVEKKTVVPSPKKKSVVQSPKTKSIVQSPRVLTAEGWKRLLLKDTKTKKEAKK